MAAPKGNKFAVGNPGGGRKSEYSESLLPAVRKLCALGATDKDLAEALGVSEQTINNWKGAHEDFSIALKEAKALSDSAVERSLFERATGYSHPDVHISNFQGDVTTTPITKHYAPDTTACIFWLKNRKPKEWRDKTENDVNIPGLSEFFASLPQNYGLPKA